MAVGLVMQFDGVTREQYDAVMQELGLDKPDATWPEGIVGHVAGPAGDGWCVVDIWESQEHFDRFAQERLGPATQKVGIQPPQPQAFEVYNMHREGTPVSAY